MRKRTKKKKRGRRKSNETPNSVLFSNVYFYAVKCLKIRNKMNKYEDDKIGKEGSGR